MNNNNTKQTGTESLAIFSGQEAIELAAGSADLANELTGMLIDELPLYRESVDAAMSLNDIANLKQHTHRLHGAARCCGTPALREAASRLESAIDNRLTAEYRVFTRELLTAIDQLLAQTPDKLSVEA